VPELLHLRLEVETLLLLLRRLLLLLVAVIGVDVDPARLLRQLRGVVRLLRVAVLREMIPGLPLPDDRRARGPRRLELEHVVRPEPFLLVDLVLVAPVRDR